MAQLRRQTELAAFLLALVVFGLIGAPLSHVVFHERPHVHGEHGIVWLSSALPPITDDMHEGAPLVPSDAPDTESHGDDAPEHFGASLLEPHGHARVPVVFALTREAPIAAPHLLALAVAPDRAHRPRGPPLAPLV